MGRGSNDRLTLAIPRALSTGRITRVHSLSGSVYAIHEIEGRYWLEAVHTPNDPRGAYRPGDLYACERPEPWPPEVDRPLKVRTLPGAPDPGRITAPVARFEVTEPGVAREEPPSGPR